MKKTLRILATVILACILASTLSGCGCKHSWQEATCASAKTCTLCGATKGEAVGHSWQEATCTAPKTCSSCNLTEGNIIEHNYVDGFCSMCNEEDPVSVQLKIGKQIFDKLCGIRVILDIQANGVYEAWYFSIYRADDDDYLFNVNKAISDFANATGIPTASVNKIINTTFKDYIAQYGDLAKLAALETSSFAVGIVTTTHQDSGLNAKNEEVFEEVKNLLKEMDSQYEEETLYSVLKDYYTNTVAYYEFITAPDGSFSQLSSNLKGYTSQIDENRQDLAFIYED